MTIHPTQLMANWQWLLTSPDLLIPQYLEDGKHLHALNLTLEALGLSHDTANHPRSLASIVSYVTPRAHQRLGIQFEHLLACALELGNNVSAWERNLQITETTPKGHTQTVGEIDFVCKLKPSAQTAPEWLHIESAVKFYLADCSSLDELNDMVSWVGPNRKDRLDLKVNRLLNHQLPLTDHTNTHTQLPTTNTHWSKRLCVKGRLYLPEQWRTLGEKKLRMHLPQGVNPGVELGWWCSAEDFSRRLTTPAFTHGTWAFVNRNAWLGSPCLLYATPPTDTEPYPSLTPVNAQRASMPLMWIAVGASEAARKEWLTHLQQHIATIKRPIQVAYWPNNRPMQRFFITPNGWSQHHA